MDNVFDRISGKNAPAATNEVQKFLSDIDFTPSADYINFMTQYNGAEGAVGDYAYLNLWRMEELVQLNKDLDVSLYAPGYFIFGSDGAGAAFAFEKKSALIVEFGLIGMLIHDQPDYRGANFTAFVDYLYNYK